MILLIFILTILFILSLLLSYQSNLKEKTTMDMINEMGIGYNLGNSFDSYNKSIEINNPEDQITLMGNPIPTKKMISNIKKYGFKTIRLPVTWINFIDEFRNITPEWIERVKEVVNWIIKKNIYCILNIYHDADEGNWLYNGIKAKDKYINLWTQIAKEFKDYNEYLVFEAKNKPYFVNSTLYYQHNDLHDFTQIFINIVRNSGGNNAERLLLLPSMIANIELAYTYLILPTDPANRSAISFNYFYPEQFTKYEGIDYITDFKNNWGTESDYKTLIKHFENIKKSFLDNNIAVIITEIGVLTEQDKERTSILEYLYALFSLSLDNEGIVSCLWDTSNKKIGNMNFYDREKDEWYDDKLQEILFQFSRKKNNVKPSIFYIETNKETTVETYWGDYYISLNNRSPLKIILNASYKGILFEDYDFSVSSIDKYNNIFDIQFGKENAQKQYDGTIVFIFDVSDIECFDFIEIIIWYGDDFSFNNVTIEYKENFTIFNYKAFQSEILKEIN